MPEAFAALIGSAVGPRLYQRARRASGPNRGRGRARPGRSRRSSRCPAPAV